MSHRATTSPNSNRHEKQHSGRISIYILIGILIIFGVSMIVVRNHREDPDYVYKKNSSLRIEVLNGCKVDRLALKATDILREQGFNVVKIGNTDGDVYSQTVIIERRSDKMENAVYFARRLGCKNIGKDIDSALYVDITIILGEDYKKLFPDVDKKI